jgi:hypothetical protein
MWLFPEEKQNISILETNCFLIRNNSGEGRESPDRPTLPVLRRTRSSRRPVTPTLFSSYHRTAGMVTLECTDQSYQSTGIKKKNPRERTNFVQVPCVLIFSWCIPALFSAFVLLVGGDLLFRGQLYGLCLYCLSFGRRTGFCISILRFFAFSRRSSLISHEEYFTRSG